jgi:hypothetical protein
MNIAIIGTAGRAEDGNLLRGDGASFGEMFLVAKRIIKGITDQPYTLISGGAAWADHVAVYTFVIGHAEGLILEVPCKLTADGKFVDTGERDFKKNPGGTSNYYHELFSKKIGFSSFNQLKSAIENPRCEVNVGEGFFDRNSSIAAKADHSRYVWLYVQAQLWTVD